MSQMATQNIPVGPAKASFESWWMLTVLSFFYMLSLVDRFIITMLVNPIKADLGLSDFQMSIILGPAFAIFYGLAGLPLGWAADRYPRRWVIFGGVTLWALATGAAGFAQSFMMIFAARVAVGIGEAALTPAVYSLLPDKFPRSRLTTAIAIYQTGAKFGSAAAFGLGGIAIAAATAIAPSMRFMGSPEPWQVVLVLVGAPGLILAFLVFTFSEPRRSGKIASGVSNGTLLLGFLRDNIRLMIFMLLGFACVSICNSALIAWVPTYIERRFGWEPIQYGPALGLVSLAGALVLVVKGGIVDWLFGRGMKDAPIRFYTWLLLLGIPISCSMFFVPNPLIFFVLDGLLNVVALSALMYFSSALSLIAPNQLRGQLTAIFLSFVVIVGQGSGPMIVGGLTTFIFRNDDAIGLSMAITTGGCVTLAFIFLRLSLKYLLLAIRRTEVTAG